ncbi:YwqG family protein [Desmospora profundinema]|nr:YwqG family protein [Desmospora profundinema]
MDKQIEAILEDHGLSEMKEDVLSTLVPCVKLKPQEEEAPGFAQSRFGGMPDWPPGMEYPHHMGKPLPFIAQFRLEEWAGLAMDMPLPPEGMLSFFCDVEALRGEKDPSNWRVIHLPSSDGLIPHPIPEEVPRESRYPEFRLIPTVEQQLPDVEPTDGMEEIYFDLMDRLYDLEKQKGKDHQSLGYPLGLEEDVFEACRRESGIQEEEWVLLLQLDSDLEELEVEWGNREGILTFCAPRTDVLAGRFDRTWVVMQQG